MAVQRDPDRGTWSHRSLSDPAASSYGSDNLSASAALERKPHSTITMGFEVFFNK